MHGVNSLPSNTAGNHHPNLCEMGYSCLLLTWLGLYHYIKLPETTSCRVCSCSLILNYQTHRGKKNKKNTEAPTSNTEICNQNENLIEQDELILCSFGPDQKQPENPTTSKIAQFDNSGIQADQPEEPETELYQSTSKEYLVIQADTNSSQIEEKGHESEDTQIMVSIPVENINLQKKR